MKLFFIDETFKQESNANNEYFLLCGLIVDSNSLIKLNTNLNEIAQKNSLANFKNLRSYNKGKQSIIIHQKIAEALKKIEGKNVIRSSIILNRFISKKNRSKIEDYKTALFFLIERFYLQLKQDNETGLIFFDNCDKKLESELKKWFYEFISIEENRMNLKPNGFFKERIYSELIFCDDKYSFVLQTTDIIASCLNYAVAKSFKENQSIDIEKLNTKSQYLEKYWSLFARDSSGKINGWGIKFWRN